MKFFVQRSPIKLEIGAQCKSFSMCSQKYNDDVCSALLSTNTQMSRLWRSLDGSIMSGCFSKVHISIFSFILAIGPPQIQLESCFINIFWDTWFNFDQYGCNGCLLFSSFLFLFFFLPTFWDSWFNFDQYGWKQGLRDEDGSQKLLICPHPLTTTPNTS